MNRISKAAAGLPSTPTSTLTVKLNVPVSLLRDIVGDADIGYWAEHYDWIDQDHCILEVVEPANAKTPTAGIPIRIGPRRLRRGIQAMLAGECRLDVKVALFSTLLEDHRHEKEGRIAYDCETGDCLVQFAAFGRLIYS